MTDVEFTGDMPVKLVDSMGSDESVVAAARVSVIGPESQEYRHTDPEESKGLINFLMKNRHGTPFEHNAMTFFVQAPIAVFREFHRHRIGWSYNEESGRYKQLEPKFYLPPAHRPIQQTGKPGHYHFEEGSYGQLYTMNRAIRDVCRTAYDEYEDLLKQGVAKEVARGVLPVYIFSSMWATCNARSLMSFLSLRVKSDESLYPSFPMWEIEQVALQMEHHFYQQFPITYDCFIKHGRVAP